MCINYNLNYFSIRLFLQLGVKPVFGYLVQFPHFKYVLQLNLKQPDWISNFPTELSKF